MDLLQAERAALRTGEFEVLDALLASKTALFARLAQSDASHAELAQIKTRLAENQSLLAAAIRGVEAARERLAALQHVRETLNTYDQQGQMAQVPTARPSMTKKA